MGIMLLYFKQRVDVTMANPVPLNKDKHSAYKVVESSDYSRYKNQHLIPIVAQDFYTLPSEFPLVFVKNSESGEFVAVAMMGFNNGHNIYCQTEEWATPVRPIGFTNPPFSVARVSKDGNQIAILIDESSPLISDSEGEPLFNADGEFTDYLNRRFDSVAKIAEQTVQTQAFCKHLASKKLFVTKQLTIQHHQNSPKYVIDGIYTIDEYLLKQMPLEEFDEMRQNGLLGLVYAHLTSLSQLNRLSQKQYQADSLQSASEPG